MTDDVVSQPDSGPSTDISKQTIEFPNGNRASLVTVGPTADPVVILDALGIDPPTAVILISGSAKAFGESRKERQRKDRLRELFSRGIARAAAQLQNKTNDRPPRVLQRAVIVDGGTQAGVMALMGLGVADRDNSSVLLGVAPAGMVNGPGLPRREGPDTGDLDPNHSHFVLVQGPGPDATWGAETKTMFCLAQALRDPSAAVSGNGTGPSTIPAVMVLAGGNVEGVALQEALAAVRQGLPIVAIEGSDGLADVVVQRWRAKLAGSRRRRGWWGRAARIPGLGALAEQKIQDPALSEIINDGSVYVFPKTASAERLHALLKQLLVEPPKESVLLLAWRRFAEYDSNSLRHQVLYTRFKNLPLLLGVLSTLFVLVYSAPYFDQNAGWFASLLNVLFRSIHTAVIDPYVKWIIVALPIATSALLALDTRFKPAAKYIRLRVAAEEVKQGIYSYRVLSRLPQLQTDGQDQAPSGAAPQPATPGDGARAPGLSSMQADRLPATEEALAMYVDRVSQTVVGSEVSESALRAYYGPLPPPMYAAEGPDDGVSPLSADAYVNVRLGDQIRYYARKTDGMERKLGRLQTLMVALGALGAILAATGQQYWLPLTAAFVSAMTAFVEYKQFEQILVKYNLTRASLENLQIWWLGLPEAARQDPVNIRRLVRESEAVLQSENQGWVQYINAAQKRKTEGEKKEQEIRGADHPEGEKSKAEASGRAGGGTGEAGTKDGRTPPPQGPGGAASQSGSAFAEKAGNGQAPGASAEVSGTAPNPAG